ncbi:hypothetical protein MTR67_013005 [Solanum verrucosum]|uniref:Gag-pol polyprotein n=1 Tax=Solanum verrucosum TaxID=315347 RepID=A0AAF0QE66_SOLVR|nr:hypothetical protein MTR67_013005 [Solanum verrucosum]
MLSTFQVLTHTCATFRDVDSDSQHPDHLRSVPDLQFNRISLIMLPHRAYARNGNSSNANAAPPVSNHEVQASVNANGGSATTRVRDIVRMNPPEFLRLQIGEDPQNFLDEIKKIFEVMQVTGNDRVDLVSYQLKDVAHIWYTQWKENIGTNDAPITWDCFGETFLDRYAPHMVANSRVEKNKFLYRVSDLVKTECRNALLLGGMNISGLMTHAQ